MPCNDDAKDARPKRKRIDWRMAPMEEPTFEPTLPKLKSLSESKGTVRSQLLYAVDIAGFVLVEPPSLEGPYKDFVFESTLEKRLSRARIEGVLRWLLDKLKSQDEDNSFVLLPNSWQCLKHFVENLPTANTARILNANRILTIVKFALKALVRKSAVGTSGSEGGDSSDRGRSGSNDTLSDGQKRSLKRKRNQSRPDRAKYPNSTLEILRAISTFLSLLISKSGLGDTSIDHKRSAGQQFAVEAGSKTDSRDNPVSAEHIKSVLRTKTLEAAEILGLCLHCLSLIITTESVELDNEQREKYLTSIVSPILQIWQIRSYESDDHLGFSARVFSKECLVPSATLYSQLTITTIAEKSSSTSQIKSVLEKLFARHVFTPARASFFTIKDRKKNTKSDGVLPTYLEPLQAEIAKSTPINDSLIRILPLILELAIKLSPRGSPKQKEAEIPWIENTFATLSSCAGEPIPFTFVDSPLTDKDISPLPSMLHVIQQQGISLSSEFLETILVDYSGLIPLPERLAIRDLDKQVRSKNSRQNARPQWRTISILLRLDGNIFLKKHNDSESELRRTGYVDALAKAVADGQWTQESRFLEAVARTTGVSTSPSHCDFEVYWDSARKIVANQVVIPLMQAYTSARDLTGFMNLWFRELRRDWTELGTPNEGRLAWTANELRHAFWELLQDSLTAGKINEQIVEYVLPFKELADEAAKETKHSVEWSKLGAIAPASAALFMLDVIVQGIDREEIFQQHLPTFMALTSEVFRYTKFDLSQFSCASRIWSIFTQLQELAPRVNIAESHQANREQLHASGIFDMALKSISNTAKVSVHSPQYYSSQEAYRFVISLCSEMLDLSDLKAKAEEYIILANKVLTQDLNGFAGEDFPLPKAYENTNRLLMTRIVDHTLVLIRYPQCFKILDTRERCKLFYALFHYAAYERHDEKQFHQKGDLIARPATSVQTLLVATQDAVVSLGSYSVMHDLVQTLTSQLSTLAGEERRSVVFSKELAVDTLLNLSPAAITRKDREAILDKLSAAVVTGHEPQALKGRFDPDARTRAIALMTRLLATANPTAKVCSDADILWNMVSCYDKEGTEDQLNQESIEILERFFEAVLKQALADLGIPRSQAFTATFAVRAQEVLSNSQELSTLLASMALIKSWLSIVSKAYPMLENVRGVALNYHNLLSSTLLTCDAKRLSQRGCNMLEQRVVYKGLADFPYAYFGMERGAAGEHLSHLINEALADFKTQSSETTLNLLDRSQFTSYLDLLKAVGPLRDADFVVTFTSKLLDQDIPPRDHGLILCEFQEWLQTLRPVQRVELFSRIIKSQEGKSSASHLQMLHLLIKSFTHDETALSNDLGACLGKLCVQMQNARNMGQFGSCIDCINTILRTKQWLVSQYGIDILLGALTTMSSSRPGPFRAEKQHAGFIYTRLCQTTTNILILHRKRAGGRFHLLVPLLQNLLSCLFSPHTRSTSSLPPWLHGSAEILNATHATSYSRVLTILSSPTSSSTALKWHDTTPNLVDEIKKAKVYAGQYVPYILMHYCSLQLSGSIGGEVRDALKSGIWSLMDVVDMEGMRGMNAGMGRDERVMWGSLYTEWNRYGKGKGKR